LIDTERFKNRLETEIDLVNKIDYGDSVKQVYNDRCFDINNDFFMPNNFDPANAEGDTIDEKIQEIKKVNINNDLHKYHQRSSCMTNRTNLSKINALDESN